MIGIVGIVVSWIMRFCTFHFHETFCADRFPTTAGAINVGWVELGLVNTGEKEEGGYEKTDGTFDGAVIDNCFEGFAAGGHDSG